MKHQFSPTEPLMPAPLCTCGQPWFNLAVHLGLLSVLPSPETSRALQELAWAEGFEAGDRWSAEVEHNDPAEPKPPNPYEEKLD